MIKSYQGTSVVCRLLFGLLLVSAIQTAIGAEAGPHLYPVIKEGKWGYIDAEGELVVSPQYDHAMDYHNGYAYVTKGDKNWILNSKGEIAFECAIFDYKPFSEGFAAGTMAGGWRFFDPKGEMLPGKFANVRSFSEGLAGIQLKGESDRANLWGYIDAQGEIVIPARYYWAGDFSDGLAPVCFSKYPPGEWGYIDKSGRVVIDGKFESAASFSEGLAKVGVGKNNFGYIDKKGEYVIQPRPFMMANPFHDGLAAIRGGEVRGQYYKGFGFMDKAGKVVIAEEFGYALDFSGGLAPMRKSRNHDEGQWGYIDKSGEWVVQPQYDHAGTYRGKLAVVEQDKQVGYIDRSGRLAWPLTK